MAGVYKVSWTNERKSICYTTPGGKKCRDYRLHEDKFLKENMKNEFNFMVVTKRRVTNGKKCAGFFCNPSEKLKSMGIPVLFVNTNLSTQDGEMMLTMLATVAQEESRNTSSRIKYSKRLNAEKKGEFRTLSTATTKLSATILILTSTNLRRTSSGRFIKCISPTIWVQAK
ncbi:MAG: recombinase family protein [Clostridiales bacterium]|nr:MAG: recombinase family protein [Clostridiales bacterium]